MVAKAGGPQGLGWEQGIQDRGTEHIRVMEISFIPIEGIIINSSNFNIDEFYPYALKT